MKRFYSIFVIVFSLLSANAQNGSNIELLTERARGFDTYKYMNGKGGVRIVSPHQDLMPEVKSGNGTNTQITSQRMDNGFYEYIIPVDISSTSEVLIGVTLKGKTYPGSIIEKQLKKDHLTGWTVRLPEIVYNEDNTSGAGLWPNPNEALIEIKSALNLNIKVPQFYRKDSLKDKADPTKNVYNIYVPINSIIIRNGRLSDLCSKIEKMENDEAIDPILLQNMIDSLYAEKAKLELEIESLTKLYVSSNGSNVLSIDINGVQPKQVKKYGVESMTIEKKKEPSDYIPKFKVYTGIGFNPILQWAPAVNIGFDCHRWNVWLSASHSLTTSKEAYVYNSANELLGKHNYHYLRLALNVGYEFEPWKRNMPLFGIMPQVGIALDHVYSSEKEISGNGFNAYKFLAGVRIALKTNNRHWCFFATPELSLNLDSNPSKNYENISESVSDIKKSFDVQVGVLYYF